MKTSGLFANISLVVLLNLLIKPASLLLEQLVQDAVGHEAWGMYATLYAFAFLFITLPDLGINQYATKTLAGQPALMRDYFPNLLSIKLMLTVLYPPVVVAAGWWWGYRGQELYLLALLCVMHGTMKLTEFFRANLQAMQAFRTDGFFSVMDKALLIGVVGAMYFTGLSVAGFVWARVWIGAACCVVGMAVVTRLYGWMRPRMDTPLLRRLMRESLPFAAITVLYSVHDSIDRVMLERLLGEGGKAATGLYAGAYRWLDAVQMYLWTILPIFFARFAHHSQDAEEQGRLLKFGQMLTVVPLLFVAATMVFYGEQWLFLFKNSTAQEFSVMHDVLRVLAFTLWVNAVFAIFSTLLTSTGHERFTNRLTVFAILLNVVLNLVFIPTYGVIAAAWNTGASYLCMSLGYIVYFRAKTRVQIPYKQLVSIIVLTIGTGGLFFVVHYLAWPLWEEILLCGVGYLGLCFATGIVPREVFSAMRPKP